MIRVRYPTGLVIEYPTAVFADSFFFDDGRIRLRKIENGTTYWIADIQASAGVVIESDSRVNAAMMGKDQTLEAIRHLLNHAKETRYGQGLGLLIQLKRLLNDFDSRSSRWKS